MASVGAPMISHDMPLGQRARLKYSLKLMSLTQLSAEQTSLGQEGNAKRVISWVRLTFWILTSIVGFVQAWAFRFVMYPDGNAYLDIASAYMRGDYRNAVSATWSPMMSWLIAAVLRTFHPRGSWESTVFHLLNFAGLLIALRCFEFFFGTFLDLLKKIAPASGETLLNTTSWWLLGYGLFFSTSIFVLTMEHTTPDVWVCVVSYLAIGLLLRIAIHPVGWGHYGALGLILGIGYLSKSFYFPLSLIFLACTCFSALGGIARNVLRAAAAFAIFAIVAGPFVFALSKSKHRFTTGDVGNMAFAMFLDPIPQINFWHGENNSGIPKHPSREILTTPRVFEFATPVDGSYPLTYDLCYWTEGVRPHFNVGGVLRIVRQSVGTLFLIFLTQAEFAVAFLILLLCKGRWYNSLNTLASIWPLWLAPLVACLAYSSVLAENRYLAPFLVFLWLGLFAVVFGTPSVASSRVATAVVLGTLLFTGAKTAKYLVSDSLKMRSERNVNWEVAEALGSMGLGPGDRVAVIASKAETHWARLAGVKIVVELPLGQDALFWAADSSTQKTVFAAFASTGSRMAVVKSPPPGAARRGGWLRLGETDYYAHGL